MEANTKRRNIYFLNVAKTLAMFLIMLGHLPIPHDLYAFINCFRMPLFFLIAGILIRVEEVSSKDFFTKKAKTLLLPYYLFAVISFLFWLFLGRYHGDDALSAGDWKEYLIGLLIAIPTKAYMGFNFPIWFLPSLFCTHVLFFYGKRWFKERAWIAFFACFGIGALLKELNVVRLPYGIDVSLFALLFIQLGQWIKEMRLVDKWISSISLLKQVGLTILFFAITLFVSQINQEHGTISMVNRTFNNYVLYFISALSGSLFILYLSNLIPRSHLFDFYGRNTIVLLGFHLMAFTLIKGIQVYILSIPLEQTNGFVLTYILYTIVAFVLLAPIIYIMNKYTPFLLGRTKGIL